MWCDDLDRYEEDMDYELDDPTYYGNASCYCGTCVYWEPLSIGATNGVCEQGCGFTNKHDKCSISKIEE